jgi:hypothetical protein
MEPMNPGLSTRGRRIEYKSGSSFGIAPDLTLSSRSRERHINDLGEAGPSACSSETLIGLDEDLAPSFCDGNKAR